MTKKTIVVTGATGLIGSKFVAALAPEHDVHCVSRETPTAKNVSWHRVDLSRPCSLQGFPKRVDAVVYLAQSEYFRDFPEHSRDIYQVNTVNLLHMLDYARQAEARIFVYGSSGGVYGTGDGRMTEEIQIPALSDIGFYLSTKLCSEIIAQNYVRFLNVVILRYFFVYGCGQRQSMLIPRLVKRVCSGEPILLQGKDGIRINPVHVSDAAAATLRALDLSVSQTVNIAGPEVLSLREIGDLIGRAVGREPIYSVDENSAPANLTGDIARMRELLVAPMIRFADGVKSVL
jgi:UDP-glucose 4-epimerase